MNIRHGFLRGWKKVLIALAALVATGCVQMSSVPGYARAGDTLVLGLGGITRNVGGGQFLKPTDLQITITDSSNATFSLTPSQVFKAYPDYVSNMNYNSISNGYRLSPTPLTPYDGGYFVMLSLVVGSSTTPLTLAEGAAKISIAAPGKLTNTTSTVLLPNGTATANREGDLTSIPVYILPGTATAGTTWNKTQFNAYQRITSTLVIKPQSLAGITSAGGAQLAITYPTANYSATLPALVVPFNHNPNISVHQNSVVNGNGTTTLNVLLTASKGFTSAGANALQPSLDDLNLSLVYFGKVANAVPLTDFQVVSRYIDTSGNVIAGLQAITANPQ